MEQKRESHSSGGIDVRSIERDLRDLWKQMAEPMGVEGHQPVMRACVLNLIVYAPGELSNGNLGEILAEVVYQHPSRVIVILPKPGSAEPRLNAWVTAQCHLSADGRKQVCCEQIMIAARGGETGQLPSVIRALLVPDLPVVLWWRDVLSFESCLFDELAPTAHRVIVDSATLPDSGTGLAELGQFIHQRAHWTAFADLSWSRLMPWREAAAGFFDLPNWRPVLSRLSRVEIQCRHDHPDRRSIPSQSFLMASWLASRLRWSATSKPRSIGEHTYQLAFTSADLPIAVEIKTAPWEERSPVGLTTLRLVAEGEPSMAFVVARSEDDSYLLTSVEAKGTKLAGKVIPLGDRGEARLLGKELETLGRDAVYEQALSYFAEWQVRK